jgi:hypothetical protein
MGEVSENAASSFHVLTCSVKKRSPVFQYFGPLYHGVQEVDSKHMYCKLCCEKIVKKHQGNLPNSPGQDYSAFFRYV